MLIQESVSWHPLPQLLEEVEDEVDLIVDLMWGIFGALEEHESPVRGWIALAERPKHSLWLRDAEGRSGRDPHFHQTRTGVIEQGKRIAFPGRAPNRSSPPPR